MAALNYHHRVFFYYKNISLCIVCLCCLMLGCIICINFVNTLNINIIIYDIPFIIMTMPLYGLYLRHNLKIKHTEMAHIFNHLQTTNISNYKNLNCNIPYTLNQNVDLVNKTTAHKHNLNP
ncbi:hypothetical protein PVLDE_1307460 [Plasmodium vinckei lentum]|uniref:Uncharacterized protein n=1 Tax=Plasmodium vinckei lentum TaxID=138297 RepID=A0A6V7SUF7_PLAVN|nr:hypothetical protein PVLDE_1307460 [Plasmodium vinckei lentum]